MTIADEPGARTISGDRFRTIPEAVLFSSISDRAIRLYLVLDSYVGANDHAWPSRRVLSARMGCSTDTIDRALKELVESGMVEVTYRNRSDGSQASSDYRLTWPQRGGGGAAGVRRGSPSDAAPRRNTIEGTSEKTSSVSGADRDFDDIWQSYPRKVAKVAARRAFMATLKAKRATADQLREATENYAASRAGAEAEFTMHGATFYGPAQRWADWLSGTVPDPVVIRRFAGESDIEFDARMIAQRAEAVPMPERVKRSLHNMRGRL